MKTYTVSASLGDLFEVTDFLETDDTEATIKAIHIILSNACHNGEPTPLQNLWANGKIVFADEDGNVIRTMNAKEGAGV
jgi:hypothetical protein